MSEIERIVAAIDRDDDGRRRVSPTGTGPARFERDATEDRDDTRRPPRLPGSEEWRGKQRAEDAKLVQMMQWAFLPSSTNDGNYFCRLCSFRTDSAEVSVSHIEDAWYAGLRLQEHYEMLSSPDMVDAFPPTLRDEARRRVAEDKHFLALSLVRRER